MFFIACFLQPTVALDTITGAATRRPIRRKPAGATPRPYPATAGSRDRFRCFAICIDR
jgi:hypothetical protein